MNKEFTLQNFKSAASKTGQILTQKGHKIPQSTLYHALSVFVGAKNWNTLQAELQGASSSEKSHFDVAKHTTNLLNEISNNTHWPDDFIYDESVILSNENIKKHLIKIARAYYNSSLQNQLAIGYQVRKEFLEDDVYFLLQNRYPASLEYSEPIFRSLKDNTPYMGKKSYHKENRAIVFNHFDYFDRNISKALLPLVLMNYLHDQYDIWGHPKPYHMLKEQPLSSFLQDADYNAISNYFLSFIDEDLREQYGTHILSDSFSEALVELRKHTPITLELINRILEKENKNMYQGFLPFFPVGSFPDGLREYMESGSFTFNYSDEQLDVFKSVLKKLHLKQNVYTLNVTCYWNESLTGEKYNSLKNTLDFLMKLI